MVVDEWQLWRSFCDLCTVMNQCLYKKKYENVLMSVSHLPQFLEKQLNNRNQIEELKERVKYIIKVRP
jgi:hypothetical protein